MGLKSGDVIIKINDRKVEGIMNLYRTLNDPSVKKLTFTVVRDDQTVDTLAYNKN